MICVTDLCKVYLVCGKVMLFLIKNYFNRINELDADLLSQPNAIIFKTCVLLNSYPSQHHKLKGILQIKQNTP